MHQKQTLVAIAELTASQGYPPTYRELGRRLGINVSTTFGRIDRLRRAGFVEPMQESATTRGLRLTEAGWQEIGQEAIPRSALRRVQHLPVFHSSDAVNRYLAMPAHRENVAAASALASGEARFIPIAELRSPENMPPARTRAKRAAPSFQFQRKQHGAR